MSKYASQTSVSAQKSRMEIEDTLIRYGADKFGYMNERLQVQVGFTMNGRQIIFIVPLPDKSDEKFQKTPTGRKTRSPEQAHVEWEKACRQRWRALALVIKAKLEAVDSGITSFEREFLANIVMSNGQQFGDWAVPQISSMYEEGNMPPLLTQG